MFANCTEKFKQENPDFVEVVRCKDCKHRGKDECPMHITGTSTDEELLAKFDDDFCSYGERKGGDE